MTAPDAALDALAEPIAPAPEPEPPARNLTPRQWVRVNLASSPLNLALTVVFGVVLAWVVYRLGRWLFVTTDWAVVRSNLRLFMVGRFPEDQLWRLWASCYVLAAVLGVASGVIVSAAGRPDRGLSGHQRDTGTGGAAAP